jgi:ATPase subunit of ABC transporter with duplicated ATPase domains
MSVLNQNHNMFDEHTVLETVIMGNKVLYSVKKEMDELYLDYNDKNADRIGELQVQFEEMNGWNADLMQLRCFQILALLKNIIIL